MPRNRYKIMLHFFFFFWCGKVYHSFTHSLSHSLTYLYLYSGKG